MTKKAALLETFIDFARSYEEYLEDYIDRFFNVVEKNVYKMHKEQMKTYILLKMANKYGFNYYDLRANI